MKPSDAGALLQRLHYGLLLAITILFGLTLTGTNVDIEHALRDARNVRRLATTWESVWLEVGERIAKLHTASGNPQTPVPAAISCRFPDGVASFLLWGVPWLVLESTQVPGGISVPVDFGSLYREDLPPNAMGVSLVGSGGADTGPYGRRIRPLVYGQAWNGRRQTGLVEPDNLGQFFTLWDQLGTGRFFFLHPQKLKGTCILFAGADEEAKGAVELYENGNLTAELALFDSQLLHRARGLGEAYIFGVAVETPSGAQSLVVPAEIRVEPVVSIQEHLAAAMGVAWLPKRHDQSFPALAAASEGLQGVPIAQLVEILEEESRLLASEVEVTGSHFSRRWLALLGTLLLVTMQWLLVRHLSALRGGDGGGEVLQWIGFRCDAITKLVVALSLFVAPVIFIPYLLGNGIIPGFSESRVLHVALAVLGTALSAYLAGAGWRRWRHLS